MNEKYDDSPDIKYPNPQYPELGTWNPAQNDSGPDTNEFFVVKNLRMQTPGQYQIRSGYTAFSSVTNTPAVEVLSKGEYSCDYKDTAPTPPTIRPDGFDVTLIYNFDQTGIGNRVTAIFFNKVTQTVQLVLDILTGVTDDPQSLMASGVQYESYFLITIHNHGLYAVYPTDTTKTRSSTPADWTIRPLGKVLAGTPVSAGISFLHSTTGDLLVRQSHTVSNNEQMLDYQPGLAETPLLRLSTQAQYWQVSDFIPPNTANIRFKQFEWGKNDPSNYAVGSEIPIQSSSHLQTNAWGYRVVYVQSYLDVHGNTITYRSQASVDFWVQNRMYFPAFLGYSGSFGSTKGNPADVIITDDQTAWPRFWRADVVVPPYPEMGNGGGLTSNQLVLEGFPTSADLIALSTAYRKYFHAEGVAHQGTEGASDPYAFTAGYLGWLNGDPSGNFNFLYKGNPPYVIPVSAYDLKKAPLALLTWGSFSGAFDFPANVIKIEVYRTAFNGTGINEPAATFGNGDPLFQPHLYGYVGSIEKDGTFTDSVEDAAIDFSKTPDRYDGYLAETFSGKVIREYNDKVALGNIITRYKVFAPAFSNITSHAQQAIAVNLVSAPTVPIGTINTSRQYFYQYEDSDGNISDISEVYVSIDPVITASGTASNIFFKIPRGYAPNITKVNIVCYDATGTPDYFLVAQVSVGTEFYNFPLTAVYVQVAPYTKIPTTSPGGTFDNVKVSTEVGGIIYGEGNQIWAFPFTNIEVVNKIFGITAMESIIGRLWVWTTRTLNLTLLNATDPQGEEETIFAGNLGFNSFVKSNKIVFFMSAHGLYFAESSGIVPFPVNVQNEILPYLNEVIYDPFDGDVFLPQLANAERCAVSWLGQRDELWVHMPSSVDLWISLGWGSDPDVHPNAYDMCLPERTFIYKLWNGKVQSAINYEFELVSSLINGAYPTVPNPITRPVIFKNHSDGTLYSAYLDPAQVKVIIMNNDAGAWKGAAYIEKRFPLGQPTKRKKLRAISFRAGGVAKTTIVHGRPYPQGRLDNTFGTADYYGEIYKGGQVGGVDKYLLTPSGGAGNAQTFRKRVRGINTAESTAYIPAVRLTIEPDGGFTNTFTLYSMGVDLTLHDHP